MAPLVIFPGGITASDAARERMEAAAELKQKLLSPVYTTEMYGPASVDEWDVKPDELMPNPDELSSRWGFRDTPHPVAEARKETGFRGELHGRRDR